MFFCFAMNIFDFDLILSLLFIMELRTQNHFLTTYFHRTGYVVEEKYV